MVLDSLYVQSYPFRQLRLPHVKSQEVVRADDHRSRYVKDVEATAANCLGITFRKKLRPPKDVAV